MGGGRMRVTLSPAERAIVEATLAVASRKQIPTIFTLKRLVEPYLTPLVEVASWVVMLTDDEDTRAAQERAKKSGKNTLNVLIEDNQARLRDWLGRIAHQGRAASSHVAPEVDRLLRQGSAALVPTLRQGRVTYRLAVRVIPGLFAYGIALILDRDRGLAQRLGQCGYCGRFNLAFEGRPRIHCNEAHRLAYDRNMAAERMRAWRKRNKKKREGTK